MPYTRKDGIAKRRREQPPGATVRCRICRDGPFHVLGAHLHYRHGGMSIAEYRRRFPRSPTSSENFRLMHREAMIDQRGLIDDEEGARLSWTREEVVAAIKRWTRKHGYVPIADEWNAGLGAAYDYKPGERPSRGTVLARFGTWNAAMRAAGLKPRRRSEKRPSPTCKHGHPWSPENTYVYASGRRACRACIRERKRRQRAAAPTGKLPGKR